MSLLICFARCSGIELLCVVQISVVSEDHRYNCWNSEAETSEQVNLQTGILAGKLALNRLHQELAAEGFTQVCSLINIKYKDQRLERLDSRFVVIFQIWSVCCKFLVGCAGVCGAAG